MCVVVVLGCFASVQAQRVRVSAWYWLNSAPSTQWPADFQAMHDLGFTDVLLVWGLDASAFATRVADSHQAIRAAHAAGLGSYLFVWHARHNALPHDQQFAQVDAAGETLFAFDAFNPKWRATQWKAYLQAIAHEYGPEPGMAGYVFDNAFAIGNVGSIDGPSPAAEASYLAYGHAERAEFGKQPPLSPQDPAWPQWTTFRQRHWANWASETRSAIRAIDPNPQHRIILEDGDNAIDPDTESRAGLKLTTVTPAFDGMNAYWAPNYSDKNADQKLEQGIRSYLTRMRAAVGPNKELALSLRLSESSTEDLPGPATYPTLAQIQRAIDTALALGIRNIDLYGYRMGVYHLDGPGWRQYQPGSGASYPLTGQIEGKFLCDRPNLWPGLKAYLHHIETANHQKR